MSRHRFSLRRIAVLMLAAAMTARWAATLLAAIPEETQESTDQRMGWWREAKFGMFIHWGLYAIPAGQWKGQEIGGLGEWIMHNARIPKEEYSPLQKQFNPVQFAAKRWVEIAKNAGMKCGLGDALAEV